MGLSRCDCARRSAKALATVEDHRATVYNTDTVLRQDGVPLRMPRATRPHPGGMQWRRRTSTQCDGANAGAARSRQPLGVPRHAAGYAHRSVRGCRAARCSYANANGFTPAGDDRAGAADLDLHASAAACYGDSRGFDAESVTGSLSITVAQPNHARRHAVARPD